MQPDIRGLPHLIEQLLLAETKIRELHLIIDNLMGRNHTPELKKPPDLLTLTRQEMKILKLIGQNKTNGEIAQFLKVAKRTIETHRYNIQRKLGVDPVELKRMSRSLGK